MSNIGDDSVQFCSTCDHAVNKNIINNLHACKHCNSKNLKECKGIKVAHTFLLGETYSKPFRAYFRNANNQLSPFVMGSCSIEVSRIIGAVTEMLSTDDQLRWPSSIAPSSVCIIPPQKDKNETEMTSLVGLYSAVNDIEKLRGDIILDDRLKLSIGRRLVNARELGIPFIIIFGNSAFGNVPRFEIHDVYKNECFRLELPGLLEYLGKKCSAEVSPKSVFVTQFI